MWYWDVIGNIKFTENGIEIVLMSINLCWSTLTLTCHTKIAAGTGQRFLSSIIVFEVELYYEAVHTYFK